MFIGPKALTFTPDRIVGYGTLDGLPRNEIADHGFVLKMPIEDIVAVGKRKLRLGDIVEHTDLFTAYPGLKRTVVRIKSEEGGDINNGFMRDGGFINMDLHPAIGEVAFRRSLGHEVQHNIQQIEGFKGGASQYDFVIAAYEKISHRLHARAERTHDEALRQKSLELMTAATILDEGIVSQPPPAIEKAAKQLLARSHRVYFRDEGEIEAYATQDRINMSAAEREAKPPVHLLATPPTTPKPRQYSTYECGALRTFARRQKLVMFGDRLCQAFGINAKKQPVSTAQVAVSSPKP